MNALLADIAKADAGIQDAEREDAAAKAKIAELQPRHRAARAVGDQPDWGTLLTLIASRWARGRAELVRARALGRHALVAGPGEGGGQGHRLQGSRLRASGALHAALSGVARTQEAVSEFVSGLETPASSTVWQSPRHAAPPSTARRGLPSASNAPSPTPSRRPHEPGSWHTTPRRAIPRGRHLADRRGRPWRLRRVGALWYFAGLQPVSQAAASRGALETQLAERDTKLDGLLSSRPSTSGPSRCSRTRSAREASTVARWTMSTPGLPS